MGESLCLRLVRGSHRMSCDCNRVERGQIFKFVVIKVGIDMVNFGDMLDLEVRCLK